MKRIVLSTLVVSIGAIGCADDSADFHTTTGDSDSSTEDGTEGEGDERGGDDEQGGGDEQGGDDEQGGGGEADWFDDSLASVEIEESYVGPQILAYDRGRELIGVITLSDEGNGYQAVLTAAFPDGSLEITVTSPELHSYEGDLPLDVLARRRQTIADWIDSNGWAGKWAGKGGKYGAFACATTVLAATGACSAKAIKNPWACPASLIAAVCACEDAIKKLIDFEFSVCEQFRK